MTDINPDRRKKATTEILRKNFKLSVNRASLLCRGVFFREDNTVHFNVDSADFVFRHRLDAVFYVALDIVSDVRNTVSVIHVNRNGNVDKPVGTVDLNAVRTLFYGSFLMLNGNAGNVFNGKPDNTFDDTYIVNTFTFLFGNVVFLICHDKPRFA